MACTIGISYSFFITKNEQHGKLNISVGTLDYRITSNDLNNNGTISLSSKEIKTIQVKIDSLNNVKSNYRLYYLSSNNDVEVFYDSNYDSSTGTIGVLSSKNLSLKIINRSSNTANITFKVDGGLINNVLASDVGNSVELLRNVTVTFNANGGSGTMQDENFTYSEQKALTANTFTRSGYTFKGWSTNPVSAQENMISSVFVGRNFTQDGDSFICDQTLDLVDSYLRIGLANNLVSGDKYVFIYEASDVPDPTTLAFGYPSQSENGKKVKNGINVTHFTAQSNTSFTIFDDTAKDANARVIFKNFSVYKTTETFGSMYKDAEVVQVLVDSGTLNLYAVWEKN